MHYTMNVTNCEPEVDPSKWLLDSGATDQMSGDISQFSNITELDGEDVHMADNTIRQIKGMGEAWVKSVSEFVTCRAVQHAVNYQRPVRSTIRKEYHFDSDVDRRTAPAANDFSH